MQCGDTATHILRIVQRPKTETEVLRVTQDTDICAGRAPSVSVTMCSHGGKTQIAEMMSCDERWSISLADEAAEIQACTAQPWNIIGPSIKIGLVGRVALTLTGRAHSGCVV